MDNFLKGFMMFFNNEMFGWVTAGVLTFLLLIWLCHVSAYGWPKWMKKREIKYPDTEDRGTYTFAPKPEGFNNPPTPPPPPPSKE